MQMACRLLKSMAVPILWWVDGEAYFNFLALEASLLMLTRFGGPMGFFAPGSKGKYSGQCYRPVYKGTITQVTDDTIKKHGKDLMADMDHIANMQSSAAKRILKRACRKMGADVIRDSKDSPTEDTPPEPADDHKELQNDGAAPEAGTPGPTV